MFFLELRQHQSYTLSSSSAASDVYKRQPLHQAVLHREQRASKVAAVQIDSLRSEVIKLKQQNQGLRDSLRDSEKRMHEIEQSASELSRSHEERDALQSQLEALSVSMREEESELGCPVGMSCDAALHRFEHLMPEHERREIKDFKTVYYVGGAARRKQPPSCWRDDRDHYRIVPGDHISYRYKVVAVSYKHLTLPTTGIVGG
eukprot:TRINITY_DN26705_c0_g1_i1.p1 TRINITY_DN26705_c0_g1~~TRINITY_DN26705_c0_g1_i1.p1  ORF type:complete len:203 (+),score=35.52 TRINITY_DN26705_c0_g1_i1:84-692(+)